MSGRGGLLSGSSDGSWRPAGRCFGQISWHDASLGWVVLFSAKASKGDFLTFGAIKKKKVARGEGEVLKGLKKGEKVLEKNPQGIIWRGNPVAQHSCLGAELLGPGSSGKDCRQGLSLGMEHLS